jgi:hypothetical protein
MFVVVVENWWKIISGYIGVCVRVRGVRFGSIRAHAPTLGRADYDYMRARAESFRAAAFAQWLRH